MVLVVFSSTLHLLILRVRVIDLMSLKSNGSLVKKKREKRLFCFTIYHEVFQNLLFRLI